MFVCFDLFSEGWDIHNWFNYSACGTEYKCSLYRRKLLGPCSEVLQFTDKDCFNLEAPLSFSSSTLCVIDSFLLSAMGYQSLWLGHQYVNYWIFVLLIWCRDSIIWDLQPLLCPLPHLKVRTNTLWENFIILLIYFWKYRICFCFFPEWLVSDSVKCQCANPVRNLHWPPATVQVPKALLLTMLPLI